MTRKHVIIPVFVPHVGCPNKCIFCNQKKISGQAVEMTAEKITQVIETRLNTIKPGCKAEIAFYGGSFTAIERSMQENFLKIASQYLSRGKVDEIRISTRPDCINEQNLVMLKSYGVKTIELGVQSLDDEVLKASCRGHNAECVLASSKLIKCMGFRLGIQTMTGLPGDSREKCLRTARQVIGIKPDLVRIYPVLVIKGTELEKQYHSGTYVPMGLEEAVDLCAELLELYENNNIKVIRIGLQATENIRAGPDSDVVAGPLHPAFGQLVESKLSLRRIANAIEKQDLCERDKICIYTGVSNISNVVGQHKANIKYIREKYKIKKIKVLPSAELSKDIIIM